MRIDLPELKIILPMISEVESEFEGTTKKSRHGIVPPGAFPTSTVSGNRILANNLLAHVLPDRECQLGKLDHQSR